jgi:hypothetical protein
MRKIQAVVVVPISVLLSGACLTCLKPASSMLSITAYAQQRPDWCWVAAGQITMNSIRPNSVPRQCEAVSKVVNEGKLPSDPKYVDCCKPNTPKKCRTTNDVPPYEVYDFDFTPTSTDPALTLAQRAISWEEIKCQIHCRKKPVAFSWLWAPSFASGHMMVAMGYEEKGGERLVHFFDPLPSDDHEGPVDETDRYSYRTYEEYVNSSYLPGGHIYGRAFYDITFVGGP